MAKTSFQPGLALGTQPGGDSSHGFQRELDAFLRERLRLSTFILTWVGLLMFAAMLGTRAHHFGLVAGLRYLELWVILAAVLAMATLHVIVRRGTLQGRALRAVDLLSIWMLIAACAAFYAAANDGENRLLISFLGLMLVARAVLVPSTPWHTLRVSAIAVPAMLSVQLGLGHAYAKGLGPYPDYVFPTMVIWDQILLLLSIGLATLASRVNFSLRRRAYDALKIDRYVLEEKIGEGAMGSVYRARHALLRRPTAIKVLRPEIAGERNFQRFEREVQLTSRLTHPNTIAVYDYGTTPDGQFYYAMELLEGADLSKVVDRTGPMPPARVIHLLVQACGALAEAHAKGLVHRDVKPSNLILSRQGMLCDVLKVMDFGLVKDIEGGDRTLTGAGEVCGSPETISPEVLRGETVTPAADLYALGAVGCFLLTGKPIFDAETLPLFLAKHLSAPPIAPSQRGVSVPEDLEAALMECLEKDPLSRPTSAGTLAVRLLGCPSHGDWDEARARAWWSENADALGVTTPDVAEGA